MNEELKVPVHVHHWKDSTGNRRKVCKIPQEVICFVFQFSGS